MPCIAIKIGDSFGIICTGRTRKRKCKFCGADASLLCDYPLFCGLPPNATCDAPMCGACARPVGEDRDYCPDHQGSPVQSRLFP
jgi:hypothetical protein